MDFTFEQPSSSETEPLDKDFVCDDDGGTAFQFSALYKSLAKNKESSQSERRERFLQEIKRRRNEVVDEKRDFGNDENEVECMDVDQIKKSKRKRKYRNRLMFTEWLCEVPSDLEENWFVKFCPYGKRCLVVSEKSKTTSYNRRGEQLGSKFESALPGGNRAGQSNKFTMLECIYSYELNCFFVLDVLYWNSVSMLDHTVDFRFFWLHSKFTETPELSQESVRNKFPFHLMEHIEPVLIGEKLHTVPQLNGKSYLYDGILFYHKESAYISGYTPLVMWLKPYMVPEVFRVSVNEAYMAKMPHNYENFHDFVKKLSSQKEQQENIQEVDMAVVEVT